MPGSSPTMARRDPISRLNRVDLPTFGRPTMAMVGSAADADSDSIATGRGPISTWEADSGRGRACPRRFARAAVTITAIINSRSVPRSREPHLPIRYGAACHELAVRLLRPRWAAVAHASELRVSSRAVADGRSGGAGARGKTTPRRRSRHGYGKDPGVSGTRHS